MAVDRISMGPGWSRWLQQKLDERGWKPIDLVRCIEDRGGGHISSSQTTRWLHGDRVPEPKSIRVVCQAFGVPALDGLIAAGYVRPGDVGAHVQVADVRGLTDEELLAELRRRIGTAEQVTALAPQFIGPGLDPADEGVRWAARRPARRQD